MQPALVLPLVARHETARGGDHPPPRQPFPVPQDVADGPRRTGMAGLLGDLAVGDDVTGPQATQDVHHVGFERHKG